MTATTLVLLWIAIGFLAAALFGSLNLRGPR